MSSFLCGVPGGFCQGSLKNVSFGSGIKVHGSSKQAFKCHKAYLIQQGYKQIGSREFQKPGEPILVLTKESRFGERLRSGKEDNRDMPSGRTGGFIFVT